MYDKLLDVWKSRKAKKEKFIVFSFQNKIIIDIYENHDIDVFRFDLDEFAELYGYKDKSRINASEVISLVRHLGNHNNKENFLGLLAVDLPQSLLFENDTYSLKNMLVFYKDTNADILVLDMDYNILELVNKLTKMKIPVIVYSKCKLENKNYLQDIHNKLMEAESKGALMLIVEGYPSAFVQNLRNSVLIPVITNEKNNKIDGYYARFSDVFGLNQESENRYLNLFELIKDSVNDCIVDVK